VIVRRLLIAAGLLLLVSLSAVLALFYVADAEFVAGAMSRLLGQHVEIGRVDLRLGGRLEVELEQIRITDPNRPDDPPLLEVAHASGVQAWPRLLAGQYLPRDWQLREPVLRVDASGPTHFNVAALPRLGLSVTDGRVEVRNLGGETWSLLGLALDAKRNSFGTRVEGDGSARLARGKDALTELALHFGVSSAGADLRGTLAGLDLTALPKLAVAPKGRAQGDFEIAVANDASVHGRVNLDVQRFALRVPKLSAPIAATHTHVAADFAWRDGVLTVDFRPLELDDLVATGSLELGSGPNGRFKADLQLAPFQPGRRDRLTPLTPLALRFASWARVVTRIEAGVAEDIHLAVDVPRAAAGEQLGFDVAIPDTAFVLELRVRDGIYRPRPNESPLTNMQGELEIRGNVMTIRRVRITRGGEPMPEINVRLDGMHRLVHLPDAEDHIVGGPGVPLDGLDDAAAAMRAGDATASEPTAIRFQDLDLRFPGFILPLRQASGRLSFPNGGVAAEGVQGVLGGAPADIAVHWDRDADRVDVDVRYGDATSPGEPTTGPRWLSGKIAFEKLRIPDWPIDELEIELAAERSIVSLAKLDGRLAGGKVSGVGHIDLGPVDRAPFALDLRGQDFDPAPLCATFGLPADSIQGRGFARVHMVGALRPGGDFANEGQLSVNLVLRDGTVGRLPTLVAIERLPSLAGVTGLLGRPLPYTKVEADLALANGRLGLSNTKLLGPQLRILGSGEMDLSKTPPQYDFVIALLFMQTLDKLLEQVPIVRNVMLGEDQNLIAVYFRVRGPRDDLSVTPLPPQAVSTIVGFASSAVMDGVRRLGALIPLPGRQEQPQPAEPVR
jgi:hypothetical protein